MTESMAGSYKADPGNLATLGPVKFNDSLKGPLTTAHPTLLEDGTLVNLIYGVGLSLARGQVHPAFFPSRAAILICMT